MTERNPEQEKPIEVEANSHDRIVRSVTRESLADWDNVKKDIGDDLIVYFQYTYGKWDWCEIYREGLSIWELMFNEKIDVFSPAGEVIAAVAAQAMHGAFSAVAAAIGIKEDELLHAVDEWYEGQDHLPPPVGYDGLKAKVEESRKWLADLEAGSK